MPYNNLQYTFLHIIPFSLNGDPERAPWTLYEAILGSGAPTKKMQYFLLKLPVHETNCY